MRKLLLTLAVLCGTVSGWAQVTKFYKPGERLSTLTSGQKVMFYNTCLPDGQDRTGFLTDNGSSLNLVKSKPSASPIFSEKEGVWTIETASLTDNYYTVNVKGSNGYLGIGGKTNNANAQVMLFHEWTTANGDKKAGVNSENAEGAKVNNADISADDKVWLITNENQSTTWNGNQTSFATWSTGHPYAIYSIVEATTDDLNAYLETAKANAIEELTPLKMLPEIFTTAESTITEVGNITLSNDDLEKALNTISDLLASVKSELNGKHVKFCSQATDNRGGRYLGYDGGNQRMAAILSDDDNVVWTLKSVGDGTFKLYNAANNHWLGGPDYDHDVIENEDGTTSNTNYRTPAKGSENEAVVYKFVSKAENVVCLVPNGTRDMVHVNNDANSNYRIMNHYSETDAASLWKVIVLGDKQVTHDSYTAFANSKKTLLNGFTSFAKQMQDNFGLVKSGDNLQVVVNHPKGNESNPSSDHQPSSNLLDGNNNTFVHSSYDGSNMNTVTYHYIQATLSEAKQNVFFYLSKRNNNNRPSLVKVYTSTDGTNFSTTPATTMIMSESTDGSVQSYFTEAIDLGGEYQYLRFEVVYTNTHTKYFTLSEFYVLPVLEETTKYVTDLTSTSVFAEDAEACLTAANTYAETLKRYGFSTIGAKEQLKEQIRELLEANKENYASEPELGQYPFETYQTLEKALDLENLTATDLLEKMDLFIDSKNRPVFTIDGVINYANGWSIYDSTIKNDKGNTHYFKPTNAYDKSMWWALDMTSREVSPIESVGIQNLGTGKNFWNCATIKITETSENNGVGIANDGIYLFYTTDNNTPIHAQDDLDVITRWSSSDAGSGSAWKFTYIGDSYDLTQLTDEYLAIGSELANINVPNFTFSANVNNYDEATKPAFDAAVANRNEVLRRIASEEEIAAAKTQLESAINNVKLNMPVDGRFYRLRCTSTDMKYLQCTQNTDEERFDMIKGDAGKTVNATFCYTNGALVAYMKPLYINHDSNIANFRMTKTSVTFTEADALGQYFINLGGRYLYGKNDKSDSGASKPKGDDGYRWWLEDVTTVPVTIGTTGYATFYCPVAVTLPEGLKAYYVSETTGSYARMEEINGVNRVIPANNGVILEGTPNNTYNLTIGGTAESVTNKLSGTVAAEYITDDAYVLSKPTIDGKVQEVGFYKAAKNQQNNQSWLNNGFKAYLPANGNNARFLVFDFGGTETGIDELKGENGNVKAEVYDLAGRRVLNAKKGVFVVNGKVIVK